MNIYYCYEDSPVGKLLLLAQRNKLIYLKFETEQTILNDNWILKEELPLFLQVKTMLKRYFDGEKETFSGVPLNPYGTNFQHRVWQALLKIPYGQSFSYSKLAVDIGYPKAFQAVAGAVGRNPISIIIPCHRVLGKDCSLTGFGGGLTIKRQLLDLEHIFYLDKGVEFVKPKSLKNIKFNRTL